MLAFLGAGCLGGGSSSADTGGFFVSSDSGKNWSSSDALPSATGVGSIASTDVTSLEIDPSDSSAYYIGTAANGMLFSYDSGTTWQRPEADSVRSGAVLAVEVDRRNVCTYYVMKADRVLKTTTCGREFDDQTYIESRSDESLTAMVIDWYNPDIIYLTTTAGDVFRSTDGGDNWATLYRADDKITAFIVSNADSRVLLLGTRSHGMMRSTDSGMTWTDFEKPLKKDYKDSDHVYGFAQTADGKTLYMSSEYGILASADEGGTWSALSLIPASGEADITALAVDPANGADLYFASSGTLYHSADGGANWTTSELPTTRAATVITVDPDDATRVLLGVHTVED